MAIKRYDVVAVTGKYTDRNGQEESRYLSCGAVFENDRGQLSIKLEGMPVGGEWNGWLSLFEPRQDNQRPAQSRHDEQKANGYQEPAGNDFDDEIPFMRLPSWPFI